MWDYFSRSAYILNKIAIIQPSFLPWRGYFSIIADVDAFVFLDDVQYDRRGWRNRNRIKTPNGLQWITVPVDSKGKYTQSILETQICNDTPWAKKALRAIELTYRSAKHFDRYYPWLETNLLNAGDNLCELDIRLTKEVSAFLGVDTPFFRSSELQTSPTSDRVERLVRICEHLNANLYLSGPSAADYLAHSNAFSEAGIEVQFANYHLSEYPQLHGAFEPGVSIIDLLFNCGETSSEFLAFLADESPSRREIVPSPTPC